MDFAQLGQRKCFGTKYKTEIANSLSKMYLLCTYVIHNIPSDSGYHSSLDK